MKNLFKKFRTKFNKFRKDRDSNLNILIECVAIIMIWRWVWDLLEIYVFPDNPFISNTICVIIWIVVLLIDDGKLWELQEDDPHRERRKK